MDFFNGVAWVIISFMIFTVAVAVIAYLKTKNENLKSSEGFFLAGHSLPGVVIAGSLLLTNLSAEQLVGENGQSWATNMSPMAWEVGSIISLIVLAYFFLPRYLKMGVATMPQLMEIRYDKKVKLLFSFTLVIMYSILNLPVILYAGALVFENIFGVSALLGVTKFQAIAFLCIAIGIVGGCYAIIGGLKAIAVSDTVNGVGLLVAGIAVPFLGFAFLGHMMGGDGTDMINGVKYIVTHHTEKLNSISAWNSPQPEMPWPLLFTGMVFNNIFFWCTNQSIIQRSLGAKSLKEGQKGAIFCGLLKCLGFLYLVVPGIIAFHIFGDKLGLMDEAYPMLVATVVPKAVLGFFAAVMFGAILSSFNSVLNSASTMFSLDIYKGIINPKASEKKVIIVGKVYGIAAGAVAIAVSPFILYANSGVMTFLNSFIQFVSLPLLCTVFGAFVFKRLPKYVPWIITAFHIIAYGLFMYIAPTYPGSSEPIHYLYAVAVLFPLELLIMWLFNRFAPTKEAFVIADNSAVDMTPWKYRHVAAVIGMVFAIGLYVVFSPLVLAS